MALSDKEISALYFEALGSQHLREQDRKMVTRFAHAVEAKARLDALTEAERICDHYATALDGGANEYTRSRECMQAANAIRALKEGKP